MMQSLPWAKHVLILGGGDGLALREVLRYPNVERVTLVDLDRRVTDLFRSSEPLVALNHHSFSDPRVTVVNEDAALWLEGAGKADDGGGEFDAVIVDFPDPSNFSLGKLYSVPFYRGLMRHVASHGMVVVQSTSPYFAPRAYWSIDATLREVGFRTWPYHVYVPSFGDWGFVLASRDGSFVPPDRYRLPMKLPRRRDDAGDVPLRGRHAASGGRAEPAERPVARALLRRGLAAVHPMSDGTPTRRIGGNDDRTIVRRPGEGRGPVS